MKEDDKSRLSEEGEIGKGNQARGGKGSKGMEDQSLLLACVKKTLREIRLDVLHGFVGIAYCFGLPFC